MGVAIVCHIVLISAGSRIREKGEPGIQMPRCRARPEKVGGGGGLASKGCVERDAT